MQNMDDQKIIIDTMGCNEIKSNSTDKKLATFDIDSIKNDLSLVIGSRESGKTTLLKSILDKFSKDYDVVMCYSYIPGLESYNKGVEPNFKIEDEIYKFIQRSERKINKKMLFVYESGFDDKKIFNSAAMQMITLACRHLNITAIISAQTIQTIPPKIRNNAGFIFYTSADSNTVKYFKKNHSMNEETVKSHIKDYGIIVSNFTDSLFSYRATKTPL